MDSELFKYLIQASPAGLAMLVAWWLLSQHRADRQEWRAEHLDERKEWRDDMAKESALSREAANKTTDALKGLEVAIKTLGQTK